MMKGKNESTEVEQNSIEYSLACKIEIGEGGRGCSMRRVTDRWAGGRVMVYKNHRWVGGRWCTKAAVGQVRDGVRKPPLGGCSVAYKTRRGMGGRWCMKTTVGRVRDGVRKPSWSECTMVYKNHRRAGA